MASVTLNVFVGWAQPLPVAERLPPTFGRSLHAKVHGFARLAVGCRHADFVGS